MPAYIIVEVSVHNRERYEEYKKLTPLSLKPYHGKFIVRGGKTETLEGDWQPERLVILEFPTADLARNWWSSQEYAPAKKLRYQIATSRMILVEGVLPS